MPIKVTAHKISFNSSKVTEKGEKPTVIKVCFVMGGHIHKATNRNCIKWSNYRIHRTFLEILQDELENKSYLICLSNFI